MEEIHIGDVVRTRKAHPCGGDEWTVTRTGADIKIRCKTCGHVVMLDRERFLRQRKAVLYRNEGSGGKDAEIPRQEETPLPPPLGTASRLSGRAVYEATNASAHRESDGSSAGSALNEEEHP